MAVNKAKTRGRPPTYPWDKWLAPGVRTVLEKGEQFHCEVQSMVLMTRRQIKRRSLKAGIVVKGLTIIIRVRDD